MKITLSLIFILWLMAGCAYTDHSRTFEQQVRCDGNVELKTDVVLEKSGSETSTAEQSTDAKPSFSIPASVI